MGLLAKGMGFLSRMQASSDGVSVTITRTGTFTNKTVSAVIGGPGFAQDTTTEIPGRIGDWAVDFIVRVEDWIAAGCTGEPKEGDLVRWSITRAGTASSHRFRVQAVPNIPAWDWGEPERLTYRIHARYEGDA